MSTNPASVALNKEAVRRLFAAFAANDPAAVDTLLTPDFLAHNLPPVFTPDADGLKKMMVESHAALQNCSNEVEDLIAEGDKVVVRYTTHATHTGDLFGIPPSGRKVAMTGIEIYRVTDGKIAECWGETDTSDLFQPAEEVVNLGS